MMDVRESSDGLRTACASDVRGVTLGGLRTGNTKSGILLQAGIDGQDSSEVAAEVKGGVVTFYEVPVRYHGMTEVDQYSEGKGANIHASR